MRLLRDLVLIVMITAGGLGASQVPLFVNQVEQRIGGAVDEADRLLDQFRSVATESRMSFEAYVDWMLKHEDGRIRQTGERVRDLSLRVRELRAVRARLTSAPSYLRPAIVLRQVERPIIEATWADFRPTLTLDVEYGAGGLVLGWFLFGLGNRTGRLASRVVAPSRPRPGRPRPAVPPRP